ncbi:MAG: hypothetical protein AB1733_23450 [Thermodesulfobacteriota bacterium]
MPSNEMVPVTESGAGDRLISEAVNFINEKANEFVYRGYEEIGIFLLERFFENNVEKASSRNPRKPAAYRKLCQREDLAIHPSRLGVMVRVAAQEKFFASQDLNTSRLSYTHKAELVKIPDGPEKTRLVKKLLEKSLSTRQTADLVNKARKNLKHPHVPSTKGLEKKVYHPARLFSDPTVADLLSDGNRLKQKLSRLKGKTRQNLHAAVTEMLDRTRNWVRQYEVLKAAVDELVESPELRSK